MGDLRYKMHLKLSIFFYAHTLTHTHTPLIKCGPNALLVSYNFDSMVILSNL